MLLFHKKRLWGSSMFLFHYKKEKREKMKDFKTLTAYTLLKTEELPDVKGTGYYFQHKKSGAKLVWIENTDDNKVFSIAFRTPPENSTGVAHIIEHTVLCGSEHFPAKDPFIELAKGSLNTFLNAMTFPDKTMYPVASCNMQDFKNLMHVYMDAVLYPNIYITEEIFKQEGWHYELESEEDEITYNGIVYSEMKGAFSSPEQVLARESMNTLFPDTSYGVESGGNPDFIPELTYEEYLNFHRRYYHPINSYIYLYGDMDIVERLEWLDTEYLSQFDKISLDSSLKVQKQFDGIKHMERTYSVEELNGDSGVYYSYNILAGQSADLMEGTAFEILDQVLFSAPGAPVKQALIDAGIGEDYFTSYNGDVLQPFFTISVKNAKTGQKELFFKTLRSALEKCVTEGLKKTSVLAAINAQEFRYKEADFGRFPKGLLYGINMMSSWLYNDNEPFLYLHANKVYAELKEKIDTGYFEGLIQTYFLDSKHGTVLTLKPKAGLNAEKEKALQERLAEYKASLSEEEVKALVIATRQLKEYQEEPSTKEQLEKIPMLSIEDIEKKAKGYKNEKFLEDKADAVWHNIETNGINYMRLVFDAKKLELSEVPYCGLLVNVLSFVDTKKHGYKELSDEINTYTGGFSSNIFTYTTTENFKAFEPKVSISMKALAENTKKAVEFMTEILCESVFTDAKRVQEILLELKSRLEMKFMGSGHIVAMDRAASYYSENAVFEDMTQGVSYYEFVKNLTEHYEEKQVEIAKMLEKVAKKLFTKDNFVLSLTANAEGRAIFEQEIGQLFSRLPEAVAGTWLQLPVEKKKEGFKTPGQVQYVVRSGNFKEKGIEYKGVYEVLRTILGYGYLWNEIRVKGGAYGAGITIGMDGKTSFYSYRDPNLTETNKVYENVVAYLEQFEADEREMTKNIIGTMSNLDFPLSPMAEGSRSFYAYLMHREEAMIQKYRDEVLGATAEDIRNAKEMLQAVLSEEYFCTVGSANKVEACKELFDTVKTLM